MINVLSLFSHQNLININSNNIANINSQNFEPKQANIENNLQVVSNKNDRLTLSNEIVNQIIIKDGFKAQITPIKTQETMTKTLLDIKA